MKKILFLLAGICLLASCSKDETPENIIVPDTGQLTQTVYADSPQGNSGVSFTTTGAWMSSITEPAAQKSSSMQLKSASSVDWVSLDPSSGDKAGSYTITISLEKNYTGVNRTATIKIICEGSEITITITQKGTKEDGEVPDEDDDNKYGGSGTLTYTLAADQPFVIDGAMQRPDAWNANLQRFSIELYNGENMANFPISFFNNKSSKRLEPGTYTGIPYSIGTPNNKSFYVHQKGEIGGVGYYYHDAQGGTATVTIEGDIYTISFDVNTTTEGGGTGTPGKIRGTYTGYLKVKD